MILVQIDGGITGDCNIKGYKGWFVVNDLGFGIERAPVDSGKAGTKDIAIGVAQITECTFTKSKDTATPGIMYQALDGSSVSFAEIHVVQTSKGGSVRPVQLYRLEPCFVSKWSAKSSGDEPPGEDVALWFNKFCIETYSTDPTDNKYKSVGKKGWDQVENKHWDSHNFKKIWE